jgi:serine/threonine-protein kinase
MDEVLAMLGEPSHTFPPTQTTPPIAAATLAAAVAPAAAPATTPPTAAAEPVVRPAAADLPRPVAPAANGPPVVGLVIAGVLAIVVIGGALGYLMLPKKPPPHAGPAAGQTAAAGAPAPGGQTLTAAQAINAMLPGMSCSWIDVQGPVQSGGPVKLAGAAGSPATVQDAVVDAATSAGVNLPLAAVDLSGVAPAGQGACSALDAFRDFKDASTSLVSPAASYTITRGPDGKLAGQPIVTVAPRNPAQDFTLLRIDPQGRIEVIYANRQAFNAARQGGGAITDLGGDAYGVQADPLNANGWSGLVLITGKGPFDENLLTKPPGARDVAWITQVRQAGDAGGWKSSMVWYKVQNNAAPPARVRAKPQGYYAHPGATGGNGGDESVPTQTEPQPSSGAPPAKRTSVWQRMFGSSSSSGSPQR